MDEAVGAQHGVAEAEGEAEVIMSDHSTNYYIYVEIATLPSYHLSPCP